MKSYDSISMIKEDPDATDWLRRAGAIVSAPNGEERVRVSLQYVPRLSGLKFHEREEALRNAFGEIGQALAPEGAELEPESISVMGQTIKALLPLPLYDRLTSEPEPETIRVDPIITRNVICE